MDRGGGGQDEDGGFGLGWLVATGIRGETRGSHVRGGLDSGADDADHGDGELAGEVVERERGCGVAGDDERLGPLGEQEGGGGEGVAGDGLAGFGAVGEAGGVTQIEVVGAGDEGKQGAEDGEAAEAGVEDCNGGHGDS